MKAYVSVFFTSNAPWSEQMKDTIKALSLAMAEHQPLLAVTLHTAALEQGVVVASYTQPLN